MSDEQQPAPESTSVQADAARDEVGRFVKGAPSPNPGGRPRALKDVQEAAAAHTELAIKTLVDIIEWAMAKPTASRVREARGCAVALLDRAWGRPAQPIGGVPGSPVGIDAGTALVDFLKKISGETE